MQTAEIEEDEIANTEVKKPLSTQELDAILKPDPVKSAKEQAEKERAYKQYLESQKGNKR